MSLSTIAQVYSEAYQNVIKRSTKYVNAKRREATIIISKVIVRFIKLNDCTVLLLLCVVGFFSLFDISKI